MCVSSKPGYDFSMWDRTRSAPIEKYDVFEHKWRFVEAKWLVWDKICISSRWSRGGRIECFCLSIKTKERTGRIGFTRGVFGPGFRAWAEMTDSWTSQTPSNYILRFGHSGKQLPQIAIPRKPKRRRPAARKRRQQHAETTSQNWPYGVTRALIESISRKFL